MEHRKFVGKVIEMSNSIGKAEYDNSLQTYIFKGDLKGLMNYSLEKAKKAKDTEWQKEITMEYVLYEEAMKEANDWCQQSYVENMSMMGKEHLIKTGDGDQSPIYGRSGRKMKYVWVSGLDWDPTSPFASMWMKCLAAGDYDTMLEHIKEASTVKTLLEQRETLLNRSALFHVIQGANGKDRFDCVNDGDNYLACLTKLLDLGANVNALDFFGFTPLFYCGKMESNVVTVEMAAILLRHGANINTQNRFGETVLELPVCYKNYECIKLLLDYGADPTIQDHLGCSVEGSHPYDKDLRNLFAAARMKRTKSMRELAKNKAGGSLHKCKVCNICTGTVRCTGCYMVRYCGRKCQLSDWKQHKSECKEARRHFVLVNLIYPDKNAVDICKLTGVVTSLSQAREPRRNNFVVKIELPLSDTSTKTWQKAMGGAETTMNLTLYDEKKSIYGYIATVDPFYKSFVEKIKTEGVFGEKGFFYAIVEKDKQLKINIENMLPPRTW